MRVCKRPGPSPARSPRREPPHGCGCPQSPASSQASRRGGARPEHRARARPPSGRPPSLRGSFPGAAAACAGPSGGRRGCAGWRKRKRGGRLPGNGRVRRQLAETPRWSPAAPEAATSRGKGRGAAGCSGAAGSLITVGHLNAFPSIISFCADKLYISPPVAILKINTCCSSKPQIFALSKQSLEQLHKAAQYITSPVEMLKKANTPQFDITQVCNKSPTSGRTNPTTAQTPNSRVSITRPRPCSTLF